ncbi:coagulation factor IX-like [Cydia pomonella]|uniref:coagulation factor IX-like n=1 Tax=Cydia pomonella TaxID=82600 RepID=UPI002ADDE7E4|nr:coagulation factor IX-like [Cydia pomonella]
MDSLEDRRTLLDATFLHKLVNHKIDSLFASGHVIFKVSLKIPIGKSQYMSFCGGSVMAENKVLTAAHCLTEDGNFCEKLFKKYKTKSLMKLYVVAGTLRNLARYQRDEQGTEQWRKMTKVSIPRRYWFPQNDICVVFTDAPFVYNDYVKPLPLASRRWDYGSMDCVASGWGKINEQMQGDSGGPLVCRGTGDPNDKGQGVIVGVACGYAIRKYRRDSFFTRVTSYLGFLRNEATTTTPVFCIVLLSQIISNFN